MNKNPEEVPTDVGEDEEFPDYYVDDCDSSNLNEVALSLQSQRLSSYTNYPFFPHLPATLPRPLVIDDLQYGRYPDLILLNQPSDLSRYFSEQQYNLDHEAKTTNIQNLLDMLAIATEFARFQQNTTEHNMNRTTKIRIGSKGATLSYTRGDRITIIKLASIRAVRLGHKTHV
jgi:hypothetical protein